MRILITAGPTREYLDAVRFLSNASSGQMGYALAEAAVEAGHQVVLVSGPVNLLPPAGVEFHGVESTDEMLQDCLQAFPGCDGVIASAAVCDYRPKSRMSGKMSKTGGPLTLELEETPDILAELGRQRGDRWSVGFALEADDGRNRARAKLQRKGCDAIVLNGPTAIGSATNDVELLTTASQTPVMCWSGTKRGIARQLVAWIQAEFGTRIR